MSGYLWDLVTAFALSAIGVGVAALYARSAGLLDVPNDRSSHTTPTPRGGGIAVVGSVLGLTAFELRHAGHELQSTFLVIAAAVVALVIIGWMDDRRSMSWAVRLPVHIVGGVSVALLVNRVAPVTSLPQFIELAWLAWWLVWTVSSINIVNFMDGIDGMVGSQGVVYGVFLFALLPSALFGSRFGIILAAACLGFLLWNWAPAKVFLGDSGSGPLGLFFAIGGALALQGAPASLIFLPLFPLFFDALMTLISRISRGERLTEAHRSHLYQRLANNGHGHALVALVYAFAAAIGAVIAVVMNNEAASNVILAIAVYVCAVVAAWTLANSQFAHSANDKSVKSVPPGE